VNLGPGKRESNREGQKVGAKAPLERERLTRMDIADSWGGANGKTHPYCRSGGEHDLGKELRGGFNLIVKIKSDVLGGQKKSGGP